ncbi:MAG: hypothetical protein K6F81_01185 [Acholeplasmatales bacterium]|nr:hypothetical protein [Acholeplasmatales bacterium]
MKKRKILLGLAMAAALAFTLTACDDSNVDSPVVETGDDSGSGDNGGQGGQGGDEVIDKGSNTDESKIVASNPGEVLTQGEVTVKSSAGKSESASIIFDPVSGAEAYNIYVDGTKVDEKIAYTVDYDSFVRTDLTGLKKGTHNIEIAAVKSGSESTATKTKISLKIEAYDRSGYAHFNYTEGVGAYKDDGTLKDNAIVLYVTDQNKNSVELTYNGKTVRGIGNILNSVGQSCGEAGHENECKKVSDGKTYYGKANTNQGILLDLAQDNIPLVVRFVGCVSDSGLYQPGTFAAKTASKIEGLTAYDGVDYGGSEGDNGHMARMKSAKNLTLEGVGSEATIDGWGFHLICETAYKDYAKNFEVRNLAFINTPEDAIGMEGQETESTLTITASVERCWVHHNTFISPKISDPAESDKGEGDGSCDFKRGRYFTCSYNYFQECHKTNLVGSSKTSVQFNLSYHHNIWYNCAARQPLARQANIHFYNNLIVGTSDTVSSLRANCYMYSESNYYMGCSRPVEAKSESGVGVCKSYNNVLIGCFNNYDATVATSREQQVDSPCKDNGTNTNYANFDTNPQLFYYDSTNKRSNCYLTDATTARMDCLKTAGSGYRVEAGKCILGTEDTDVTSVASSETISGSKTLTIGKAKGVVKVFTVTSPVTITIAATSTAGFDTGYLLKQDGTLVLALSSNDKTAVLENGVYVICASQCFTASNGKNDKETTVTKCVFEAYDSAELNAKLLESYNQAVSAIPATITYTDSCYTAIKSAMDIYATLGDLQSQVSNYSTVTEAFEQYKAAGKTAVEAAINAIGTVSSVSGSAISSARDLYNTLVSRCPDVTISNYKTLTDAEEAYSSFAVDACKSAIDAIGDEVTIDSKAAIENAEALYAALDDGQKADVTNYAKLTAARTTYNSLVKIKSVNDAILAANDIESYEEVIAAYSALSASEKSQINTSNLATMYKDYTIAIIETLPATITRANKATIELARNLYDSLSSENQALVTNYSKLTDAEAVLATLPSVQVTKTLTASDFNITGASTTVFNGNVWKESSITGISKTTYTDVSKVVLNATRYDGAVSFKVSYSTDGITWTSLGEQQPKSNKTAQDLEFTITATGDLYIKVEIVCSKDKESNSKQGTINSIKVTCYE